MSTSARYEDRLLDWFESGPVLAPDEILDSVAASIHSIPQRRAWRAPWRFATMPVHFKVVLAAAAAAGAASVAGALLLSNPSPSGPMPEPIVAPSSAPETLPESLAASPLGSWGAPRGAAFGLPAGRYVLEVDVSPVLIVRGPQGEAVLLGDREDVAEGVVQLGTTDRCSTEATYEWALLNNNRTLSIAARSDACVDRRNILDTEWSREGVLAHELVPERPYRVDLDQPVVFTVPAGFMYTWSGHPPFAVVLDEERQLKLDAEDYFAWVQTSGRVHTDRCDHGKGLREPISTLDDFVAWNRATTGATVSDPVATTVGGYPAVYVDIAGTEACPHGALKSGCYCMALDFVLGGGFQERTWAVDLGNERIVILGFHDDNPPFLANTPERLAVAQSLIDSIQFP